MFYLGLWCKRQRIAVPLSRVGINGDNAGLAVVNVIAQMLVQSQGNGCIYFVVHSINYKL